MQTIFFRIFDKNLYMKDEHGGLISVIQVKLIFLYRYWRSIKRLPNFKTM